VTGPGIGSYVRIQLPAPLGRIVGHSQALGGHCLVLDLEGQSENIEPVRCSKHIALNAALAMEEWSTVLVAAIIRHIRAIDRRGAARLWLTRARLGALCRGHLVKDPDGRLAFCPAKIFG
jgi:hypothetical protein